MAGGGIARALMSLPTQATLWMIMSNADAIFAFCLKSCDFRLPDRSFQKKLLCVEYICLHVILIY